MSTSYVTKSGSSGHLRKIWRPRNTVSVSKEWNRHQKEKEPLWKQKLYDKDIGSQKFWKQINPLFPVVGRQKRKRRGNIGGNNHVQAYNRNALLHNLNANPSLHLIQSNNRKCLANGFHSTIEEKLGKLFLLSLIFEPTSPWSHHWNMQAIDCKKPSNRWSYLTKTAAVKWTQPLQYVAMLQ